MATGKTELMPPASLHSYLELFADICKFGNLGGFEKQKLLCALNKDTVDGPDILQSLTRKQLKHYLNFRTGVKKTFTSYSKCKLIDRLVKTLVVNNDASVSNVAIVSQPSIGQLSLNVPRRLRKAKHPTRLTFFSAISSGAQYKSQEIAVTCKNAACRAKLSTKHEFCKRCSCSLCHKFDDNKDPSLWIICEQDDTSGRRGCGKSCHLDCALNRGVAGVLKVGAFVKVDGGYCCQSCGKIGELLGCWKKQLLIAKEARRIDVLCHRLSLAHRLLQGTFKYKDLHVNVHVAAESLQKEIGPFGEAGTKLVRGIVSRLSNAALVQSNIDKALTNLEILHTEPKDKREHQKPELPLQNTVSIHFRQVSSSSFTVTLELSATTSAEGIILHELWHRKVNEEFGNSPTFSVRHKDLKEFFVSDLEVSTEYVVRVVTTLKKGIAVENEASCLTKGIEQRNGFFDATAKTLEPIGAPSKTVNKFFDELDCIGTTFKVRDIAKILSKHASIDECNAKSELQNGDDKDQNQSNMCNPYGPTDYDKNELETLAHVTSDAFNFKGKATKQELSESLSDHPFKSCKLSQNVLLPAQASSQLDSGKNAQNKQLLRSQSVDKFPVATDICSFVYAQESKQTQSDILQSKGSSPGMVAEEGQCLDIVKYGAEHHNHTWLNSHSVKLINYPDANREVLNLESIEKTRKRFASDDRRSSDKLDHICQQDFSSSQRFHEKKFEYCVTVIRWLEQQGQVGAHFRKRFLSWLGVRATDKQKKLIDAYIKLMIDDPESLAKQLIDTYEEIISMARQKVAPNGC
ncbi:hypothetical protein O6H91_21G067000 [Diphasiastrum complanatum]|uniref:Uncharacterized protein n=3 Tax=Diphasiastrum complanatum TaxID=34168 RepID=A0ACC2ALN3_DIPCM|nr:hypothetical protein O6H91_21G067000 [Diphasiastrum complanatum]KAJ7518397.1 hypothetical protein O6H91_21G067000 [Diphasiastrum complanatum]KAJ7518398.1 hypothetical protein O6H91_21G067000 [Diphasiastrum complanatum]